MLERTNFFKRQNKRNNGFMPLDVRQQRTNPEGWKQKKQGLQLFWVSRLQQDEVELKAEPRRVFEWRRQNWDPRRTRQKEHSTNEGAQSGQQAMTEACMWRHYWMLRKELPERIRGNSAWHSHGAKIITIPTTRLMHNLWGIASLVDNN